MQKLLNMFNMVSNVHVLYFFIVLVQKKASSLPITAIQPFGSKITRLKSGHHCQGIQSVFSQVNPTKQTTPISTSGSRTIHRTQVSMTMPHTIAQYGQMRIHMQQPIQKKNGWAIKHVMKVMHLTDDVWVNNPRSVFMLQVSSLQFT